MLAIRMYLPSLSSLRRWVLFMSSAYASEMFFAEVTSSLLSTSTASGETPVIFSLNSKACAGVCWAFILVSTVNGMTSIGLASREVRANLYSPNSTSTLGLTLFMNMLCLATLSTLSDCAMTMPPGTALLIHERTCPMSWSR